MTTLLAMPWLSRSSRHVIRVETRLLPKDRRDLRCEEWLAELGAVYPDRPFAGLAWSLSLSRISAWERITTPVDLRAGGIRALRSISAGVARASDTGVATVSLGMRFLSAVGMLALVLLAMAIAGALFGALELFISHGIRAGGVVGNLAGIAICVSTAMLLAAKATLVAPRHRATSEHARYEPMRVFDPFSNSLTEFSLGPALMMLLTTAFMAGGVTRQFAVITAGLVAALLVATGFICVIRGVRATRAHQRLVSLRDADMRAAWTHYYMDDSGMEARLRSQPQTCSRAVPALPSQQVRRLRTQGPAFARGSLTDLRRSRPERRS
jgi:hypothetical protein